MRKYERCDRCIMDTSDPDITFNENGFCNHCEEYFTKEKRFVLKGEEGRKKLEKIVEMIKEEEKEKKYDCVLGVSGGTDSSYVAYLAKKFGLRVLLLNLNNGYDTEIAQKNIKNIVNKTGFDIYNYKVDWQEFRDLQLSYLNASVVDVEVASDHAIMAATYNIASEYKLRYILSGTNIVTEGIMPKSWNYQKNDLRNLKDIHKKFGKFKLKTYPTMGLLKWLYYRVIKRIRLIEFLNYLDYNKDEVKKLLKDEFDWKDYTGKHYESRFTKFYQTYILPKKFNIDKRKAHFSTLICSGQMTKDEALKELLKPLYNELELKKEKKFILDRLQISDEEFEDLMKKPVKKHEEYATDRLFRSFLLNLSNIQKKLLKQKEN